MVVDTSAIVAVLFDEPEAERFADLIEAATAPAISAVTRAELTFVVEGRKGEPGRRRLERFLEEGGFRVAPVTPVTPTQAEIACEAFRRFGKGRHPAALNIGDCFAYALAHESGEPLLFKGDDFGRTDVASVTG